MRRRRLYENRAQADDAALRHVAVRYKEDVFAALDYYLANLNGGRSFRLAGEGQGRQLVDMILKEYMPLHPEYAGLLMQA